MGNSDQRYGSSGKKEGIDVVVFFYVANRKKRTVTDRVRDLLRVVFGGHLSWFESENDEEKGRIK